MLFKSFDEIKESIVNLSMHVNDLDNYLAHLPAVNKQAPKEKLLEHTKLVNESALKLIEVYNLETVIDKLTHDLLIEFNYPETDVGNFIKELFLAAIAFHDYGKLNENFQAEIMQNSLFTRNKLYIGSHHSLLSAYLFINHYLDKLEKIPLNAHLANSLAGIICAFADPILKHHSPILAISDLDKDKCQGLDRFLKYIGMNTLATYWPDVLEEKKHFSENVLTNRNEPFALYALIKLNFSLLTASDYLATLSYQYSFLLPNKSEFGWYGLFSSQRKDELNEQFKHFATYNREALEETEQLKDFPFSQLRNISNSNLNLLRSRTLAEVVWNIRNNSGKKLFYLQAPTGAGKTNISLAAALELLRANQDVNKLFYVFPFTTLITQTYKSVKETLGLGENDIVQIHSKAAWHEKNKEESNDGQYGVNWENHLDNLFAQYPIVLLSHIRFFDILKSNRKEINYLLHRIANSVVVIDELQSYSPTFWEHVNYFITHFSNTFNIRFILMSATLPEIGQLTLDNTAQWVQLIKQPKAYFQNPNFSNRALFDFSLLSKTIEGAKDEKLRQLANFIYEKSEQYVNTTKGKVKTVVEFITKKSAADFFEICTHHHGISQYTILMLTGTMLELRRRQIINWIKSEIWVAKNPKILLISTQVVEAGVDIDMDVGFKDTSLLDSDEQLAGRINRNATKSGNTVYLFHLDGEGIVYKGDERLKIQRKLSEDEKQQILKNKNFDLLYDLIIQKLIKEQTEGFLSYFRRFKNDLIRKLNFGDVDREFQLIKDGQTKSVFIPLEIPVSLLSGTELNLLNSFDVFTKNGNLSGAAIFAIYEDAIKNPRVGFIQNKDYIRKIQSLLSLFTISVYPQTAERIKRQVRGIEEIEKYGFIYWKDYRDHYSLEEGLKFKDYQCDFL